MIAVNGIYENGIVRLERHIESSKSRKVIVTFLEEELQTDSKILTIQDFSFLESREQSKRYKGSLSDAVVEERKSAL